MGLSDFWANATLDHLLGKATLTPPGTYYVALSTADPGDDGAGLAEPSGSGYARASFVPGDFNTAGSRNIDNSGEIQFPAELTGALGTATHIAVFDASSAGNLLWHAPLTTPLVLSAGITPRFQAGVLDLTVNAS